MTAEKAGKKETQQLQPTFGELSRSMKKMPGRLAIKV
jgi:hypothetical protein